MLNQFWILIFFFLTENVGGFQIQERKHDACGDIFHQKDAALRAFGFQIPPPTGVASSAVEGDA